MTDAELAAAFRAMIDAMPDDFQPVMPWPVPNLNSHGPLNFGRGKSWDKYRLPPENHDPAQPSEHDGRTHQATD